MDFDIEDQLRDNLNKGEKLFWTGRPATGIKFQASDIYLIPFSIMWCGFAIFWEVGVITSNAPFFFRLWGIPFVLFGLYLTIGRFFFDALQRKNTIYGITDSRVIIKAGLFSKEVKSLNIKTMSDITFREKKDGSGTIMLGPSDFRQSFFIGFNSWSKSRQAPSLDFIEDVKNVYNILITQQRST